MSHRKPLVIIIAAIVLIAASLYCFFRTETPPPEPSAEPPALAEAPSAPKRRKPRPAAAPSLDTAVPVESPQDKPQCTKNNDCIGPRTADCIHATCEYGKCRYDDSACECRTAADCEDSDPCTRNHCFLNTMKCIFIPDGCK